MKQYNNPHVLILLQQISSHAQASLVSSQLPLTPLLEVFGSKP